MAFLKNMWKNNSKHKKLCEEWALATSMKDLSESNEEFDSENIDPVVFNAKYLGCTNIEMARSKEATSEAVKSVITTAKTTGRKLQRVGLSISPKGIEMTDGISGENLLQVSIYRISYCSADANHDHVFAFISSANDPTNETEGFSDTKDSDVNLTCHAFLCQKRKIAQELTLTVAKSFETAYQQWKEVEQRKKLSNSFHQRTKKDYKEEEITESSEDDEQIPVRSLLIDFSSELTAELCSKDHKQYFQNTWVSFEDDGSSADITQMPKFQENMWEKNMICSS